MIQPRAADHPANAFPADYAERVYAGVLGKLIGVYLGRPFEGWSHERIMARGELGPITGYVHERFGVPLVVTDDDIAGTFTFVRALADAGYHPDLSPRQIGEAWRNYLIDGRTMLWWGGLGISTEHTAYLRLMAGIDAPESGSIARNGRTIAEQIGAQIFIDGWAMLFPGDPEQVADFARRAASVSHDGEAIYGAQVVAAIEAMAFVERDIDRLLDIAVGLIPADSTIARVIADLRDWHARDDDWLATRALIEQRYGYDRFPGACHMVPNHALIIHALLHGNGDFARSQMIVNSDGWDTDCNAGNVGCILGIRDGLAAFTGATDWRGPQPDWRGPVTDRLYLSTAEGGRAISDAVIETDHLVMAAHRLRGLPHEPPKDGTRFHFSQPGSVQGFMADDPAMLTVDNAVSGVTRALRLALTRAGTGTATTPTFIPEEALAMPVYRLIASPTLFAGQRLTTRLLALPDAADPVDVTLVARVYRRSDAVEEIAGPSATLAPNEGTELEWTMPDTGGAPIMAVGFRLSGPASAGVLVDRLGWSGAPETVLRRVVGSDDIWRRAWVDGVDQWDAKWPEAFRLSQNRGIGLIAQGTADWQDYRAEATISVPLARSAGVAVRVGGLRRYLALVLAEGGVARLVAATGERQTLAEAPFAWRADHPYRLSLTVRGETLEGRVGEDLVLTASVPPALSGGGAVGLVIEEGTLTCEAVHVSPI